MYVYIYPFKSSLGNHFSFCGRLIDRALFIIHMSLPGDRFIETTYLILFGTFHSRIFLFLHADTPLIQR